MRMSAGGPEFYTCRSILETRIVGGRVVHPMSIGVATEGRIAVKALEAEGFRNPLVRRRRRPDPAPGATERDRAHAWVLGPWPHRGGRRRPASLAGRPARRLDNLLRWAHDLGRSSARSTSCRSARNTAHSASNSRNSHGGGSRKCHATSHPLRRKSRHRLCFRRLPSHPPTWPWRPLSRPLWTGGSQPSCGRRSGHAEAGEAGQKKKDTVAAT